ncbi:MAG: hypothetical protein ACYC6O_10250 [Thermoleophilia bacterium]
MGEAAEHLQPVPDESGKILESVKAGPESSPEKVQTESRPRAGRGVHWRVDLKWVFGIPFTVLLMLSLVFISLFQMTSRESAVETLTSMNQPILATQDFQTKMSETSPALAAFVQSPGFAAAAYDDPAAFDAAVATIPAPGTMPPQVEGASGEAAAELAAEQQSSIRGIMALYGIPLKVLNSQTHSVISGIMMALVVLMVLTGVPFILLSRRAGRFVSPGISFALASWLPLLILGAIQAGMASWVDARQAETTADGKMLADVVRPFNDNLFGSAMSVYSFVAYASLCLFVAAAVTYSIARLRERQQGEQAAHMAELEAIPTRVIR